MDRRGFLAAMPALVLAPTAFAQTNPTIAARGLNHVTVVVPDLQQSVDFYQGLFGLPKERRNRTVDAGLRIASTVGIDLTTDRPDRTPRIDHFCLGVEHFDVDRVVRTLEAHGLTKSADRGAMKVQVSTRDGATLVYLGDPDGVSVQLQDFRYCGGTGPLGNECPSPEPSPRKGLIAIRGYTGVSVTSTDPNRSSAFYHELFGNVPLSLGPGSSAAIHHFSFAVDRYDQERVAKALESYGVHPHEGTGLDRGSLFFTDLNGILVQLR